MISPIIVFEGEEEVYSFDYSVDFPLGATSIASSVVTANEWLDGDQVGTDKTADVIDATIIVDKEVRFRWKNFEAGKDYRIKAVTTFNDGQKRIGRLFLKCKEA